MKVVYDLSAYPVRPLVQPNLTNTFAASVLALSPSAQETTIEFEVEPQQMDQWCWAAVSASVGNYFGGAFEQCQVASAVFGTDCCADPTLGDYPERLEPALTAVGHYVSTQPPINPQAVGWELGLNPTKEGRPIPIRVEWSSGGGHFLAIRGIVLDQGVVYLQLTDPIYGDGSYPGSVLLHGQYPPGGGQWKNSYLVAS